MAIVSFRHDKNGEELEMLYRSVTEDFTRDDLVKKFEDFMDALGYRFPKLAEDPKLSEPKFEME
jgi:hypothetical protein